MDKGKARERLLEERRRLAREMEQFQDEFSESMEESTEENTYDQHMADVASPMYSRELDMSLEGNVRRMLDKIDRALEKIDEDTYGICDNCGRQIAEERLEVAPHSTLCIDCIRKLERE
ncbi:MAG: TraR/DksA C4-type zinc finger protein [Thermoleophilia bacterium]